MKKVIATNNAPAAVGPYSQAITVGKTLYLSGQIGLNPTTGRLVEGGVAEQARQCLRNIKAVLETVNATPDDIVKTTIYLVNINDFAEVNAIYAEFFTKDYPARSCVAVQALPLSSLVEIEVLAVLP